MESTSTQPADISTFIITSGLTQYRASPHTRGNHSIQLEKEWQLEQVNICWLNFLTGFISIKIVQKQDEYYRSMGRRTRGQTWAAKIISMLDNGSQFVDRTQYRNAQKKK
jgi:hypothetical protein